MEQERDDIMHHLTTRKAELAADLKSKTYLFKVATILNLLFLGSLIAFLVLYILEDSNSETLQAKRGGL